MAKVKFSAFVSDIRNKSNGSVFSKNRYGSIIRNKVTPTNPQTQAQQQARSSLGNLSSSFRGLTIDQIKSWNSAGKNFPFTDIFGDVKHLSGQTLFVKLNANLEKVNLPRVLSAPAPSGFPELPEATLDTTFVGGDLVELAFKSGLTAIPAGYTMVAYATPGISRSISFVKNEFRFIGEVLYSAGEGDLAFLWNARFAPPLEDEVIHVKIALIKNSSGQQSIPLIVQATV